MKTNLTHAAAFALLLLGCRGLNQHELDIPRIAAITQEATRIGTTEALRDHPEWTPIFLSVRDQLNGFVAAGDSITVAALLDAVSRLPVRELSSDTARLSFEAARLVLSTVGWSDVEIIRGAQIRAVIIALSNGITSGLPTPGPAHSTAPPSLMLREGKYYKVK